MIIRCKAPLRLSFGGGGTDVEPYMTERGGSVINATINKYAYGTLIPRTSKKIQIKALDLDLTASYEGAETYDFTGKLDLATAVLRNFRPDRGLDIYMHCEVVVRRGTYTKTHRDYFSVLNDSPYFRQDWGPHTLEGLMGLS